jgi:hypothetical protein
MNRTLRITLMVTAIAVAPGSAALAQTPPTPPASPVIVPVPTAKAEDVASIDAIITALYAVISGPAGQPRDWARMRSLFVPGGRLMPTRTQAGKTAVRLMEVNDYIALAGPNLERGGFEEKEIARVTEQFGPIAHVFSTYGGKMAADTVETRGINSIQLLNDGTRWWVVNVYWAAETRDLPLPSKYMRTQ